MDIQSSNGRTLDRNPPTNHAPRTDNNDYAYDQDVIRRKPPKSQEISYEKHPQSSNNGKSYDQDLIRRKPPKSQEISYEKHPQSSNNSKSCNSNRETTVLSSNLNDTPSFRSKVQQSQEEHRKSHSSDTEKSHPEKSHPMLATSYPIRATSFERSLDNMPVSKRSIILNATNVPIYKQKEEIMRCIQEHQVTIISGDTGCGKSTQVPKYILEDAINRKDPKCKIICTQPRRIAATNLQRRVHDEVRVLLSSKNEEELVRLGYIDNRIVGYQVGMDSFLNSQHTRILFVTNGIFLQRFIHTDEKESILEDFTHIILDEVHERDIDSDFIMLAVKHLLAQYKNIKLVLMSATINAGQFSQYFSAGGIANILNEKNVPVNSSKKDTWDFSKDNNKPKEKSTLINLEEDVDKWDTFANDILPGWDIQGNIVKDKHDKLTQQLPKVSTTSIGDYKFVGEPAPIININGGNSQAKSCTPHPIATYHLDQIYNNLKHDVLLRAEDFSKLKPALLKSSIEVALEVIKYILRPQNLFESSKKYRSGVEEELPSVLVFLPGLNEIETFKSNLEDALEEGNMASKVRIILLHSTMEEGNKELAFRKFPNLRKIILATNIAESSITISDVKYVIDFCLTKELQVHGRRNIEKLELVWASKASCTQRMGRTGRVCFGICFRIVPQAFFEQHMEAFSTPELIRCSLDKLILRIKVLHESEKKRMAVSGKKEYVFQDVKAVLYRAIEPPNLDQIGFACKSLVDNGAITANESDMTLGELTFLGSIYCVLPCEVRIAKLCLMGLVLDCFEEALILAAILQQQKNVFYPDSNSNPRNKFRYFNVLWDYADGEFSDHIALIRLYRDWESTFIPEFDLDTFEGAKNPKLRRTRRNYNQDRRWCEERCVDRNLLKEVYFMKEDLKYRFYRLKIINSRSPKYSFLACEDEHDKKTAYKRFKVILAAAFTSKFIEESFEYNKKNEPLAKCLINDGFNSHHAVQFTHEYTRLSSQDTAQAETLQRTWKSVLSRFGDIEKLDLKEKTVSVQFTEETYEKAIKLLNYIFNPLESHGIDKSKTWNQMESYIATEKEKDMQIETEKEVRPNSVNRKDEQRAFESILQVEYAHRCRYRDFYSGSTIKCGFEGLNGFGIRRDMKQPALMVTNDWRETKSGFLQADYTTYLDYNGVPYMLYILAFLFSSEVHLTPNQTGAPYRYEIATFFGEKSKDIPFYLTNPDVSEFNEIRALIARVVTHEDQLRNHKLTFQDTLEMVLFKTRVAHRTEEEWENAFLSEVKLPEKDLEMVRPTSFKGKLLLGQKKLVDNMRAKGVNFLKPIQTEVLSHAPYSKNDSYKFLACMNAYEISYKNWKKYVLNELKDFIRLIDKKEATFHCPDCGVLLCTQKNLTYQLHALSFYEIEINTFPLKELDENWHFKFFSNTGFDCYQRMEKKFLKWGGPVIKKIVYGDANDHPMVIKTLEVDWQDISTEQKMKNLLIQTEQGNADLYFLKPLREATYVPAWAEVKVEWPDLTTKVYIWEELSQQKVAQEFSNAMIIREGLLKKLKCKICNPIIVFENAGDFTAHLAGRTHKDKLAEFCKSLGA